MVRIARVLLLVVVLLGLSVPASADSGQRHGSDELSKTLGVMWTTVLQLPSETNPFTSNNFCIPLPSRGESRLLVPFAPAGTPTLDCRVRAGTKVFVAAWTSECSTIEDPPFFGDGKAALRACARAADAGISTPKVTLDQRRVPISEVVTPLLNITLPAENIFGKPAGTTAQSVGHGWVALLHPLPVGRHTIILRAHGIDVFGNPVDLDNTTTITVTHGR